MTPFVCFTLKMTRSCFLTILTPVIHDGKARKKLPFLDTMLDNGHSSLITTVFRKRTFTGPLTNYFSFAPLAYKLGLVRTLVDRGRFPFDQKFRCEFPEISKGEWYRLFQCGKRQPAQFCSLGIFQ